MRYENFTQMPVWIPAFDLVLKVYQITKGFPPDKRFGRTSDMRRCASAKAQKQRLRQKETQLRNQRRAVRQHRAAKDAAWKIAKAERQQQKVYWSVRW